MGAPSDPKEDCIFNNLSTFRDSMHVGVGVLDPGMGVYGPNWLSGNDKAIPSTTIKALRYS